MSADKGALRLAQAGLDSRAAGLVLAARLAGALGAALLTAALLLTGSLDDVVGTGAASMGLRVAFVVGAAAAGAALPGLGLDLLAARRKRRIGAALPDLFDLLVVCVESGLGIDAALRRVTDVLAGHAPELAGELAVVNEALQQGHDRAGALVALEERTGVADLSALSSLVREVDTLGTSVADGLRRSADGIRTAHRFRAQQKAATLPTKMTVALVAFFLGPFLVVVLAPMAITISAKLDAVMAPTPTQSAK